MILNMNGKAISGRENANYQQLLMILIDLQKLQSTSPALTFLMQAKIKRFYEQNNLRIQSLKKNMDEIAEKHVKKTENGKLSTIKVNGSDEYEFESDEQKAAYGKAYNDFMSIRFELHS